MNNKAILIELLGQLKIAQMCYVQRLCVFPNVVLYIKP